MALWAEQGRHIMLRGTHVCFFEVKLYYKPVFLEEFNYSPHASPIQADAKQIERHRPMNSTQSIGVKM